MTAPSTATPVAATRTAAQAPPAPAARSLLHAFLIVDQPRLAVPARVGALHVAAAVRRHRRRTGYVSIGGAYNLDNYVNAWNQAELPQLLPEHAHHRGPGGDPGAVPGLDGGVRGLALQLALQPAAC